MSDGERRRDRPAPAQRSRAERLALARGRLVGVWVRLDNEQRIAGIAAVLVIVSTLGPFSFVEAAELLTAAAVLTLLWTRAERRQFHLPFGDGTVIAAAGVWCAALIATRMFDRPPGQTVLALVCALLLAAAGVRARARDSVADRPGAAPGPEDTTVELSGAQSSETPRGPGPT